MKYDETIYNNNKISCMCHKETKLQHFASKNATNSLIFFTMALQCKTFELYRPSQAIVFFTLIFVLLSYYYYYYYYHY